ncbi:CotH kinase family protein [Fictibacillus sp. NRS-1165]|uniref:CotH kinase family protein n=1 Tax=Fictibacillus sp. NRS-1165 TaxID=3144463 RepID=UPI003D1F8A40
MQYKEIPKYYLKVPIKGAKTIEKGKWAKQPVKGKIKTGGTTWSTKVKFRGAHILSFPKKSYDLEFSKKQDFNGAVKIHLNAEYVDPSLMRNKLSLDFFREIGVLSPEADYIVLYINNLYQGIYLALESVDKRFLRKRGLPEGSIYYAISENANFSKYNPTTKRKKRSITAGYEIKYDQDHSFNNLRKLMKCILTASENDFPLKIEKLLDVEQYFKWLAGAVCTQNFDGFIHNYALYKNGDSGRFEILPWDYDATWGRDIHGDIMGNRYVPIEGYNSLTARLLLHRPFKRQYKQIMEEVLEDAFTCRALEQKIFQLHKNLRPYLVKDPYKHRSLSLFDDEPDFILDFIKSRNRYLKERLTRLQ